MQLPSTLPSPNPHPKKIKIPPPHPPKSLYFGKQNPEKSSYISENVTFKANLKKILIFQENELSCLKKLKENGPKRLDKTP